MGKRTRQISPIFLGDNFNLIGSPSFSRRQWRSQEAQGTRPPSRVKIMFFQQNFTKKRFYHIGKIKWPKSEEKAEIEGGGLEKLGGPPDDVPGPGCLRIDVQSNLLQQ